MKRCIYCGSQIEENEPLCPKCGKDMNPDSMSSDDVHFARQHAYAQITFNGDKRDGAMTCYVIGGILLVLGVIFFVLSFRYNTAKVRVFRPASVEFVVSMILLVTSVSLLTYGTIRIVKALKEIRFYRGVIEEINGK